MTNPSRSRSNGRHAAGGSAFRLDSTRRLPNPARAIGVTHRSHPPTTAASTHPRRTHCRASESATLPLAHAAATTVAGPVSPSWPRTVRISSGSSCRGSRMRSPQA